MNDPAKVGWILVGVGLLIVGAGVLFLVGPSLPWLGRLPGDVRVGRGPVRFYFPLTTCLLLSLALTLVVWLVRLLRR